MGQKVIIVGFGGNLAYRLRTETTSPRFLQTFRPLFADLSSTTHV